MYAFYAIEFYVKLLESNQMSSSVFDLAVSLCEKSIWIQISIETSHLDEINATISSKFEERWIMSNEHIQFVNFYLLHTGK